MSIKCITKVIPSEVYALVESKEIVDAIAKANKGGIKRVRTVVKATVLYMDRDANIYEYVGTIKEDAKSYYIEDENYGSIKLNKRNILAIQPIGE